MKYIKGDLIALADSGQFDVIVHGCNCFNTMGSGVAKAIRDRWPEVYEADCRTKKGDWKKLGKIGGATVTTSAGTSLNVVNAYTQYNFLPRTERHLEYSAVRDVFLALWKLPSGSILIPKIGAGLARGDWSIIEKIIDSYGLDVTCCTLE